MNAKRKAFTADAELAAALEQLGTASTKAKGSTLFREGDPAKGVYLLCEGRAVLSLGDASFLPAVVERHALLGLPSTLGNKPYSLTARLLTEGRVVFIEREKFLEYLRKHPVLCLRVVEILSHEVREARIALKKPPVRSAAATQ